MNRYSLTIKEIRKETNDTITLCFKQPGLRKIKYQAGQYLTLIVRINGRKYARPYSFSSAPSVDEKLEVTVKRVPNGKVSNYINDEVKVGDVVEVMEPMGDFTFDALNPERTIYLWGVGSGITPLYSLTKEILKTQSNTKIHLVYGNKLKESSIFSKQLLHLQQENADVFKLTHFYSQENIINEGKEVLKGRITPDFVSNLVSQNANCKESLHYICGPIGLKETVKNALFKLNIPSSSVFIEDFELVIDPKELESLEDCKVSLLFDGVITNLFIPKGKSILEIALDNKIEIPYSCQTGNCNTCKGIVKNGQLKMLGLTKERDDLAQDEFLLCCSYPLTSEVSVEVK
jgi:ring-1,2-phenylacetyl-CoA epoxidase subunit PaaE